MSRPSSGLCLQQATNPSVAQIEEATALFAGLMKDDHAVRSLVGGDITLLGSLGGSMIRAGIHSGEYYEARHEDTLVGFLVVMPPGNDMFGTEEQRALGLTEFMKNLSEAGKNYYTTVYMKEFPAFVNACLGPTGKVDSWYINMLMVKRDYQGQGVGKSLISLVRKKAEKGGDTVALSTTTKLNSEIYQKIGLTLRDYKRMPSPWGDWDLYLLSMQTGQ